MGRLADHLCLELELFLGVLLSQTAWFMMLCPYCNQITISSNDLKGMIIQSQWANTRNHPPKNNEEILQCLEVCYTECQQRLYITETQFPSLKDRSSKLRTQQETAWSTARTWLVFGKERWTANTPQLCEKHPGGKVCMTSVPIIQWNPRCL